MATAATALVVDIVLRLIGAFYVFASVVGLRKAAMDHLLTQAIGALSKPDPKETTGERRRARCLIINLLLVGVGGAALMAAVDIAAWIFAASLAFYALYLLVLAPRLFDPFDPPDEAGRAQTWNAFWVYAAATILVLAARWAGRLMPINDANPLVLTAASAVGLALAVYGARLLLQMPGNSGESPMLGTTAHGGREDDHLRESAAETRARIRRTPLVMRPSWNQGAFFDARSGEPIELPMSEDFTVEDDIAVSKWLTLFADHADDTDPHRCALRDPASLSLIAKEGQPIFRRLADRLGTDRIRFDPQAVPVVTKHTDVTRIKLMADYPNHPIWMVEDDRYEPIDPDEFGISWRLARDIGTWEMDYAGGIDADDPNAQPPWSDAEHDAHEERGRKLAVRLARELALTGRGHVLVNAYTRAIGVVPVRPDDPIG